MSGVCSTPSTWPEQELKETLRQMIDMHAVEPGNKVVDNDD